MTYTEEINAVLKMASLQFFPVSTLQPFKKGVNWVVTFQLKQVRLAWMQRDHAEFLFDPQVPPWSDNFYLFIIAP